MKTVGTGSVSGRLVRRRRARGAGLTEVLAGLFIVTAVSVVLMARWLEQNDSRVAEIGAAYHARIAKGAADYVTSHYADLLELLPAPGNRTRIPFETLKAEGFVPASLSAHNPWRQSPALYVMRGPSHAQEQLEAVVVSEGGEAIANAKALEVARAIGAEGGYTVGAGEYCGTTQASTALLCSTQGLWNRPAAEFGVNVGPGRIVTALFFLDGAQVSDYLYRKRVPGRPELNTMETYLQLGSGAVAVEGDPCLSVAGDPASPSLEDGAIARTADGLILSCQSGVWKQQYMSSPTVFNYGQWEAFGSAATRYCPAGTIVLSSAAFSGPSGTQVCQTNLGYDKAANAGYSVFSGCGKGSAPGDIGYWHHWSCMAP